MNHSFGESDPKWLQIGYAKSGNFWLYRILERIAFYAGLERKSFIKNHPIYSIAKEWDLNFEHQAEIDVMDIQKNQFFYTISGVFRMPIQDIDEYLADCSHVWMHAAWGPLTETVLSRFNKVIYIVRDPRDVAISLSHFVFTPHGAGTGFLPSSSPSLFLKKNFPAILEAWARHVSGYLKQKENFDIYFVIYENFLNNFEVELEKLLEYLGIVLEPAAKTAVRKETDFLQMREASPVHLRKGQWGQWRKDLSKSQHRFAERFIGSLLSVFGYPRSDGENVDFNFKNQPLLSLNDTDRAKVTGIIAGMEGRILIRRLLRMSKRFWEGQLFSPDVL